MFGLFKKNSDKHANQNIEQAVILRSVFESGDEFGTEEERHLLQGLEDKLAKAFENDGFEHDGHEIGDGEFIIYCYGSDADKMLSLIEGCIKDSSFVWFDIILRYGAADNKLAKEKQIRVNSRNIKN